MSSKYTIYVQPDAKKYKRHTTKYTQPTCWSRGGRNPNWPSRPVVTAPDPCARWQRHTLSTKDWYHVQRGHVYPICQQQTHKIIMQVRFDQHIPCRADQCLVLPVVDVLTTAALAANLEYSIHSTYSTYCIYVYGWIEYICIWWLDITLVRLLCCLPSYLFTK